MAPSVTTINRELVTARKRVDCRRDFIFSVAWVRPILTVYRFFVRIDELYTLVKE